jgi:hypothetical protein
VRLVTVTPSGGTIATSSGRGPIVRPAGSRGIAAIITIARMHSRPSGRAHLNRARGGNGSAGGGAGTATTMGPVSGLLPSTPLAMTDAAVRRPSVHSSISSV